MKVFISHPFADEDLAATLQKILKEKNIDAYMAQRVKEYELKIDEKVTDEIINSDYVVAIITTNTRASASVNQELGFAQGKKVPRIALIEKDAKVGVLLHGVDSEDFTRDNFAERCERIRTYLLDKTPRVKIDEKDKTWLKDNVYRPLYNSMIKNLKDIDQFNKVTENPWENLEPYVQLKIEGDVKQLIQDYVEELRKYENMILESEAGFIENQVRLGEIIKPAFDQAGLIEKYGHIRLDDRTTQEPKAWINAFKFIIFDREITNEQILYDKLLDYSIKTKNGYSRWLEKWKQRNPGLFFNILKVIPDLRNAVQITITTDELNKQKTLLSVTAEQLSIKLEEKLK